MANYCRQLSTDFQKYCQELVKANLFQYYNNLNTAVDYCVLWVYIHTLIMMALRDIPLNSTSYCYCPHKEPPVHPKYQTWHEILIGGVGQVKVLLTNYGNRPTSVQTVGWSPYTLSFVEIKVNFVVFLLTLLVSRRAKVKRSVIFNSIRYNF